MRSFFRIKCFFVLCACSALWAQIPNPAFFQKKNQLSVSYGQSYRDRWEKLFIGGISYGQPNEFFRLPGRINVEFLTAHGIGDMAQYKQDIIFGFAQDLISPPIWRMYAGINLGIYIKPKITERINSRFTFGERAFLGYNISENWGAELYWRHFSNGDLTDKNKGQNFIGLNGIWKF